MKKWICKRKIGAFRENYHASDFHLAGALMKTKSGTVALQMPVEQAWLNFAKNLLELIRS